MNSELEKYYEERFSLMLTPGWAQLMEDAQIMRDNYANIMSINTAEELQHRKGQLDILDWLLSLKSISELTYADLQEH